MSLNDAKLEIQNAPRVPPVSWYLLQFAAVIGLAVLLASF